MPKGFYTEDSDIGELVRQAENDFTSGTTHVSKYVDFSLSDDINKIYAYLDSKHTSGETDALGREKPFFNISLAARNIWFRATDLDRRNIKIKPTKSSDDIAALLATVHVQDWMRRENFGQFLNNWGLNMAGFNETVVKFVEKDGRLIPTITPWSRIICDSIDFASNPKIELLELTEAQLYKHTEYDKDMIEKLCDAKKSRETTEGQNKDNKNDYIKLYEIHGELPLSYLTGNEEDKDTYVQQMHVISFVASKDEGRFDDFTLYAGKEAKDPYMLTALLPEIDGSIALRGSVKTLFDAQWMQNHTIKAIKDQLDLASKLIFQTSDTTFVGQNALTNIETGQVLIHKVNEPVTLLNNRPDTTALQNFGTSWKQIGNEITGISEAMLGINPPSGSAWRQTEALLNESHSLFEIMTENKGLAIEAMFREFIIPYIKKGLDTSKEVSATLSSMDIQKIDARFIKNASIRKTNTALKEKILGGEPVTPEEQAMMTQENAQSLADGLSNLGSQRFFAPSDITDATWKEVFKDLEWNVEVDVTGESFDKDALTTINTMFMTLAKNPQILQNPTVMSLWNKILERTGAVSPAELPVQPPPQAQNMAQVQTESLQGQVSALPQNKPNNPLLAPSRN